MFLFLNNLNFLRFAEMEMAIVAVEALSRFWFRFELTDNHEEVKPAYGFVTKPNKEILVNVSRIT